MKFRSIINRIFNQYIKSSVFALRLGIALLVCAISISCIDENIITEKQNEESNDEEFAHNSLTLYFESGDDFSTRYATNSDVELNDSYIRKYRVKFFEAQTGNDYFLFESDIIKEDNNNFEVINDDKGNEIYKTKIQIGNLKDNNGNPIAKLIRDQLKDYPFKVAFIVNMPNEDRTEWGFDCSYLNTNPTNLKTIHDLHFLYEDKDKEYSGKYPFLAKDNWVSDNVNWVQERSTTLDYNVDPSLTKTNPEKINSESNASKWIKSYWDPMWDKDYQNGNKDKPVYREYANLWQYWNFGGSTYGDEHNLSYKKLWNGTEWGDKWKKRNADWFIDSEDWFKWNEFWFSNKSSYYENDGLWVVQNLNHPDPNDESTYVRITKNNGYGIILPKSDGLNDTKNNNDFDKYLYYNDSEGIYGYGCIRFMAPSSGNLRIKYNSLNGGNTTLRIQRSSNPILDVSTTSKNTTYKDIEIPNSTIKYLSIKITGDPEPIFIYNVSDNPAVVYAVEYISDTHLYETNWEGMQPSLSTKYIPMYGVEQYDAIGVWNNGQTIDLRSKPVALIRSIAKVVVNLPKRAKAVYMRCMNSNAANEPGDVSTPTSITWKEKHKSTLANEEDCEWFRIQSYKPWYQSGLGDHDTWMKWFYGTWKSWKGWTDTFYTTEEPPHIFNPNIIRSDFCEFIYAGEVNGYHRYVLYTPEKAVDDPNTWSDPSSSPKVIHIEYRYDTDTSNFDDNSCYRIYFTDYKNNDEIKKQRRDTYDSYEQNNDNLQKHWPILRNHVYTFNVSESSTTLTEQNINVRITPWGYYGNTVEETW